MTKNIFESSVEKAWCPGCGNHPLLEGIKQALSELKKQPHEVLIASGIGQAAKLPHYINTNGFNGLHGRAIPPAAAAKIVNPELTVIIHSGDGDSYGEGGNHLIHNIRRNVNLTHFVHDNQVYGLTKGQASPTTLPGYITDVQTEGVYVPSFNPIALAISLGCTFVARTFVGDRDHMVSVMKAAIEHKGYALVDIFQPCVVFNKTNTFQWYKEHVYRLDEDYDSTDKIAAFAKAQETDEKIPIGIIYKEDRSDYLESVKYLVGKEPLVKKELDPQDAKQFMDILY
jgi:2-oxoglutarate/2-oxoacid ferredoxin oxidoreductase subunit beta